MYVRLAFAVAAHLEPEILIVDEVLAVGDAEFQKKCLGKMEACPDTGRTVMLVSHNLTVVTTLCGRAVLMEAGRKKMEGESEKVISAYIQSGAPSAGATTRRAILNLLKREGPLTAIAVARALALTPAAIRMQLVHLEEDGLLSREESATDSRRRGGPSYVYTLTAAAEALYPKRYGDLTTELLGYLGGPDGKQVEDVRTTPATARSTSSPPVGPPVLRRAGDRSQPEWTKTATWPMRPGKRTGAG